MPFIAVRYVVKDMWIKVPVDTIRGAGDRRKTVRNVVREIIEAHIQQGESPVELSQFGLYSVSHGYWLENDKRFCDYALKFSQSPDTFMRTDCDVLELQVRDNFISTAGLSHYAEGSLLKKGHRSLLWKKRRFVLRNYILSFYNEKQETGSVDLAQPFTCAIVHGAISEKIDIELHLKANEKVYRLTSEDLIELRNWIRILRSIHGRLHSDPFRESPGDGGNSPIDTPEASDVSSDDENQPFSFDGEKNINGFNMLPPPPLLEYGAGGDSAMLSTFKHLRLSDALNRQSVVSIGDSSCAVNNGKSLIRQYADIQGDKIGFMYKKGGTNTSLKYRLFVLRDKILYYYKLSKDTGSNQLSLNNTRYKYAGMINLEGCKIYMDRKSGRKSHIFRIVTPSRVYLICTTHREEWEDWKDAFEYIAGIMVERMSSDSAANVHDDDDRISLDSAHVDKPYKLKLKLDYEKYGKADYAGFLMKQGNDRIGKWRKRWFVLLGRTLFYMELPSSDPLGSIPLRISNMELTETSSEDLTFNIVVKNSDINLESLRVFKLKALNKESFDDWIAKLQLFCSSDNNNYLIVK